MGVQSPLSATMPAITAGKSGFILSKVAAIIGQGPRYPGGSTPAIGFVAGLATVISMPAKRFGPFLANTSN